MALKRAHIVGIVLISVAATFVIDWARPKKKNVAAPPRPTHVILITLDTLRADHLGLYGYFRDTSPNLDEFAARALVFERAMAPMATTFPSHLSLFTGVYPSEHGYLSNTRLLDAAFVSTPGLRTAAEKLREIGYDTAAFVGAAPVRDSTGLNAGFDVYDQPDKDDWKLEGTRTAEQTTQAFLDWLGARQDFDVPLCLWIHYFDPHWPYAPPPPYDALFSTDAPLKEWVERRRITLRFPDKWREEDAHAIHNRYDGEIRYLDDQLGRVLDALTEANLLADAWTVIAADHGEGLGQHDWPAHGQIFGEQLHVPLVIRPPNASPLLRRRISRPVSLVDVFPTVFGLAGPPLEGLLDGQATGANVLAPDHAGLYAFSERADRGDDWEPGRKFALTGARWRYYHFTQGRDRLHDLRADPYELLDVIDQYPDVARMMRDDILRRLAVYPRRAERLARERGALPAQPDPTLEKALKGLGYTEKKDPDEPSEGETVRPNP